MVMNQPLRRSVTQSLDISPAESAEYTKDMVTQLKAMAEKQGQTVLAHLLALAALEADSLARPS
jgi:hypothetical protein